MTGPWSLNDEDDYDDEEEYESAYTGSTRLFGQEKQKKGTLEVEICWFPIVALGTDIVKKPGQNRSIYCKARVWARKSGLY